MPGEQELQEKMMLYKTLESRLEVFGRQRELVSTKVVEILSTLSSIEEIGKKQESVLFKLGSEAYVNGQITDGNKILVEIGAGVVLEKPLEEGKQILNKRKEEMENALNEIQTNISQLSGAINKLAPEINELMQKSQTQTPTAG